jgi:hypothetical protein
MSTSAQTMNNVIRQFNDLQIIKEFPNTSWRDDPRDPPGGFIISKEEVLDNYDRVFEILASKPNDSGICVITDAFIINETNLASYANNRLTNAGEGIG